MNSEEKKQLLAEIKLLKKKNKILEDRLSKTQSLGHIGDWYNNVRESKQYWSDEIYRIMGFEPNEIEADVEVFESFIHPDDMEYVRAHNRKATSEGRPYEIDFRIVDSQNSIKWMHTTGKVVIDEWGQMLEAYGLMHDITDFKVIEEKMFKAKEIAEAGSREKSLFLANMSHEIRVPMNGILGMVNLLLRTNLTSEQLELTSYIKHSSDSLMMIINDILDLSKIEAGKMLIEYSVFDLEKLIKNVMAPFRFKLENKNIDLNYNIDHRIPTFIKSDYLRIQQVLRNLIGNAVKFTKEGLVELSISLLESTSDVYTIEFKVKDSGIGISSEKQADIFKEFTQADGDIEREFGGTGLGLSICKQLVGMMNGVLKLESDYGKGSVFSFSIEVPVINEENTLTHVGISGESETVKLLRPLKILIAEDNYINQKYLKSLLVEVYSCSVTTVDNGYDALKEIQNNAYDCVLMDGYMPVLNGLETTRKMRRFEREKGINKGHKGYTSIIALTADAIKGDEKKYVDAGMDYYLAKPVNEIKLVQVLNKIPEHYLVKDHERVVKKEAHIQTQLKYIEYEQFMHTTRTMSKPDVIEVLNFAVVDYPKRIQLAMESLENNEIKVFKETIHYIAGSLGYFHAEGIVTQLRRFEQQVDAGITNSLKFDFQDFLIEYRQFVLELEVILKRIRSNGS